MKKILLALVFGVVLLGVSFLLNIIRPIPDKEVPMVYEVNNSCPPRGVVSIDGKRVYKGNLHVEYKKGGFDEIKKIIEQEGGNITIFEDEVDFWVSAQFCGDWSSGRLQSLENKFKSSPSFEYMRMAPYIDAPRVSPL